MLTSDEIRRLTDDSKQVSYDPEPADTLSVKEPEPAYAQAPPLIVVPENTHDYPNQGFYTIDDYLALPDDQRVELIDGVIYDMGAPTIPHQLIGGDIYAQLLQYVKQKGGKCMPFIAPTDVQLDCDNRTMVQPDVLIVCDRSRINRKRIFGAPDFVAEVLSPSTKRKDILIKGRKYADAGVKEYWLIDPMEETVMVFDFREDFQISTYTFEDKVPVLLYGGDCVIDFREIKSYYAFLDEEK
ncbi:MAG: Uma2 family endonuclease [Parasporobacterium sp.]|nr:Uma2 family endonuclease [Parasporobacterium sp.]MBQ9033000.1 Uma2 family endonuclease [Parasporobacterium sp.]